MSEKDEPKFNVSPEDGDAKNLDVTADLGTGKKFIEALKQEYVIELQRDTFLLNEEIAKSIEIRTQKLEELKSLAEKTGVENFKTVNKLMDEYYTLDREENVRIDGLIKEYRKKWESIVK